MEKTKDFSDLFESTNNENNKINLKRLITHELGHYVTNYLIHKNIDDDQFKPTEIFINPSTDGGGVKCGDLPYGKLNNNQKYYNLISTMAGIIFESVILDNDQILEYLDINKIQYNITNNSNDFSRYYRPLAISDISIIKVYSNNHDFYGKELIFNYVKLLDEDFKKLISKIASEYTNEILNNNDNELLFKTGNESITKYNFNLDILNKKIFENDSINTFRINFNQFINDNLNNFVNN
ncbi:hypothetical protein UJ101_01014 [Flavobacteriaceae bacterium UJ101]|nr:hypothetical protein UJ101_01014 [Flavobacteriaceae bacterium UJ101]